MDRKPKHIRIAAGACYGEKPAETGYSFVRLDLTKLSGEVWLRKFDDDGLGWIPRVIRGKTNNDGLLKLNDLNWLAIKPSKENTPTESSQPVIAHNTQPIALNSIKANTAAPKVAVLKASSINEKYYDDKLLAEFKKLKCAVHYFCLTREVLNELEGYDYIFILSKVIKQKIIISDNYLTKRTISLQDLENNICDSQIKGLFIFVDQKIESSNQLMLPMVIFSNPAKDDFAGFIFHAFKKAQIHKDWFVINQSALKLIALNDKYSSHDNKTPLPDSIDRKNTQNYIGRRTELENICRLLIKLKEDDEIGFLTLKGSGGLGKTATIKKIAVALADRALFKDGINFIDCEVISDYQAFEFEVARTFNLEQASNIKAHIKQHIDPKDALLILDNFETLLHKTDSEAIKAFLNFICDYVSVVITSRELTALDCEQPYELRRFSSDDAMQLFLRESKQKLSDAEQKFLREEIIENLLDNNPLAIEIITNNLPTGKDFSALKTELEDDIFQKLTDSELSAFDDYADTNIERKKSLYASINFSYRYLSDNEKMAFEVLSLFPDGISIENLKNIGDANRKAQRKNAKNKTTSLCITDPVIRELDNKSMIVNDNGIIKLQSIVGKFAQQQLNKRSNKSIYYHNAFEYNQFLINSLEKTRRNDEYKALKIFSDNKNNFLKSVTYIDLFDYPKEELLDYLDNLADFFSRICTNQKFITLLSDKHALFSDKKEQLCYQLILIYSRYFDGEFEQAFKKLTMLLPKQRINMLNGIGIERYIARLATHIYEMEGDVYFSAKIRAKIKFSDYNYDYNLYQLGEYNAELVASVIKNYIVFEVTLNSNRLNITQLDNYIASLYEKNHIEIMTCYYIKAKYGVIDKAVINKLVLVNPYTQGLQQLIFAFCAENTEQAIAYYENALINLKHIKYHYVEALLFYARFLKTQQLADYARIYEQGYQLAKQYYFRFLIYQFEILAGIKTDDYHATDYPLPDNTDFKDYIQFLIKDNTKR